MTPPHPNRRRTDQRHFRWLPERWYRDVWLLLVTIVVLFAVVSSRNASNDARHASNDALHAVDAVQANRLETIAGLCQAQNARNRATVHQLHIEIHRLPPRQRERALRNVKNTIALINTLDPVQDCAAIVARARVVVH